MSVHRNSHGRVARGAVLAVVASSLTFGLATLSAPATAALDAQYNLAFVAGTGTAGAPTEGPALGSSLDRPYGVAIDAAGNRYVADSGNSRIEKISPAGDLSIIAGNGILGGATEGPATSSALNRPLGVAVDSHGNVYVADYDNNRVEKVSPSGSLSFFAGTGLIGPPSPGPATSSRISGPVGLVIDPDDNVYIADSDVGRVVKVTPDGTLSVVAGSGQFGTLAPGPATSAKLAQPTGLALDAAGNLYITDFSLDVVAKVTPGGTLSIVAGTQHAGPPTPGPATSSAMSRPSGVAVDAEGNVFVSDRGNNVVERITPGGILSVVAGTGQAADATEGPATASALNEPIGLVFDAAGALYIADRTNNRVEKLPAPAGQTISFTAPTSGTVGASDTLTATGGASGKPVVFTVDASSGAGVCAVSGTNGAVLTYSAPGTCVVDANQAPGPGYAAAAPVQQTVTVVAGAPYTLSFLAGTGAAGSPTPGPATSSKLSEPSGTAVDASGNVYIADTLNNRVERVTPGGSLSIFAGTGTAGAPTPGPATSSNLDRPTGVAVDPSGNVYIADFGNNRVEKVTPAGTLSLLAGTGIEGAPAAGPASASMLNGPYGVAVDGSGTVYIADRNNERVEKVTSAGMLSVLAGYGPAGEPVPGPATASPLFQPSGVAVDATGNVYIADLANHVVEKVTPDGTLSVFATGSNLARVSGVAVDAGDNVYLTNYDSSLVEKVTPAGVQLVIAGTGTPGAATEGPATSSALRNPTGVAVTAGGTVYVADQGNDRVEKLAPVARVFNPGPTASISAAGNTLTAHEGAAVPTPDSYSYLWTASGDEIATTKEVTLSDAQANAAITLTVTAHRTGYADSSDTATRKARIVVPVRAFMMYGDSTANFSYPGPTGKPDLQFTGILSCTAVVGGAPIGPTTTVGAHVVDASTCSGTTLFGDGAQDYDLVYAPDGYLQVSPAAATITASSQTISYGSSPAPVTASYSGFRNGETSAVLTVAPTCSTAVTATSPPGTYPTWCFGAAAANYAFLSANGEVVVTKAAQAITFAQPGHAVVGGPDVPLVATSSSGLPVAFTSQTPATCTVVAGKARPVGAGTCTIVATQDGNDNYLPATPVTRSLSVAKAPITVTTSSTSSLFSLLTLRVVYTTVVRSAVTGQPVAGEVVTTRVVGGSANTGCTAITNAQGVATCTAGPVQISILTPFTATVPETASYQAGTGSGRTKLL